MIKWIYVFALAIAASLALAACNHTAGPTSGVDPVNKIEDGLALGGYDSVAYFTEGKAVKGDPGIDYQWRGATWRFATSTNRDSFIATPEKYAPQYGGYCSWAVGHGYTAKGDPEAWKIVEDKLYLNYNQDVKMKWEQEAPMLILKGNENWLTFQKTRPEHKGAGSN
jgi:hypothetical protein